MKTLKIQPPGSPENADPVTIPVSKSGGIGTLNLHDAVKGLLIAAVVGGGTVLYQSITDWINYLPWNVDWMNIVRQAVSAGLGYLSVNFFSQAKIIFKAKELIK